MFIPVVVYAVASGDDWLFGIYKMISKTGSDIITPYDITDMIQDVIIEEALNMGDYNDSSEYLHEQLSFNILEVQTGYHQRIVEMCINNNLCLAKTTRRSSMVVITPQVDLLGGVLGW